MKAIQFLVFGLANYATFQANAAPNITFDQYRFVLNNNVKSSTMTLRNAGNKESECNLNLVNYKFSESNQLSAVKNASDTFLPANKIIRYSPRTVKIQPGQNQKVKISYRRRANINEGEYISFFNVSCSEELEPGSSSAPTLGARINYHLPVHIRVGKLNATPKFEIQSMDADGDSYKITVRQYRVGNRSLIGNLIIKGADSGEILTQISNQALYRPSKFVDHTFRVQGGKDSGLLIEYKELFSTKKTMAQKLPLLSPLL